MKRVLQGSLTLFLVLVAAYLAIVAIAYGAQNQLMFHPTGRLVAAPSDAGMEYERVRLRTSDGVRIEAWWLPPDNPTDRVVLFFHGNAGNISHRLETLRFLRERGLGVLILSYRGYGPSEGRPSEMGLYRDGEAAWAHLVAERELPPARIILFGRSMGGAVAAYLAERERPAAVVLESTFTSVPDLAAELYPWLPARVLSRLRFDTLARVTRIDAPILVLHSVDDEIIPFRHGMQITAASERATLVRLSGSHNLSVAASGRRYARAWDDFLAGLGAYGE